MSIFHSHAQCELELVEFNFDTGYIEVVIGEDCPSTDAVGLCIHLGVDTFYCGDWGSAFFHPTMYFMDFQAQFWVSPTTGIANPGDTIILDAAVNSVGSSSNPYTVWECFQQHQYYDPSCDGGWVAIWQVNGSNGNPGPNDAPWESVNTNSDAWIDSTFESTAIALANGCCPLADTIYLTETDTVVEYIYLDGDTIYLTETDTTYILEIDTLIEYVDVLVVDTLIEYVYVEPDTVYVVELDTLTLMDSIYFPVYFYDTTYVYLSDTVIEYEEVYIYQIDTLYEYEVVELWIDCFTGLECVDDPPGMGEECDRVWVPNAFSPNNDGHNDAFYVVMPDSECWGIWNLSIYNRWGNIIWKTNNPEDAWEGDALNENYYAEDGVYTWVLRAEGHKAKTLNLSGSVLLFR